MKKIALALSLFASVSALAEEVPKPVQEVINVFQHSSSSFEGGVLSMTITKPIVNEEIATSFFVKYAIRNILAKAGSPP